MVGFDYFVIEPLVESGITFKTQEYLSNSAIPILILHAEDDWVVPFALGIKVSIIFFIPTNSENCFSPSKKEDLIKSKINLPVFKNLFILFPSNNS